MAAPENPEPAPEELHNSLLFAVGVYLGRASTAARSSYTLPVQPGRMPFISRRLPVLSAPIPPHEQFLDASDTRPLLERYPDLSLVGKISLWQVQPLQADTDPAEISHFWAVNYLIDTVGWEPVRREITGERLKSHNNLVVERTPLPNLGAVIQRFPAELAVSEAEELIAFLDSPVPPDPPGRPMPGPPW